MPAEPNPAQDELSGALASAAALGVPALATLVATAEGGVVIVDGEHRYVYANPAACLLLGRTLERLRDRDGRHAGDQATTLARFVGQAGPHATTFSGQLSGADGVEREVVCSTFAVEIDGVAHGAAVIWDFTARRDAARTALALARTAAQLVGTAGSTNEILTGVARHAVEGSGAISCGISVVADDHTLASAGAFGPRGPAYGQANPAWLALAGTPVERAIEAMSVGTIVFGEPPGKPTVVADARTAWEANPITAGFAANLAGIDWRGGVYVPLAWQNRTVGFLAICLPATQAGPTEADLALYRALADQAAVVVMNARFAALAGNTAALVERTRLARELHDSVSQGLFSMTMHARAAQLALTTAGFDDGEPLGHSITQLADLTRGALAEMRALIFELRPGALTAEGLVGALGKIGAALSAREQLVITVDGAADHLHLQPELEEHVYRIAAEAMNNVAKHSRADQASVLVRTTPGRLTLTVIDNGQGFDPAQRRPGHLGMTTMAQRASAIGGELTVVSAPGTGTTVRLSIELPAG